MFSFQHLSQNQNNFLKIITIIGNNFVILKLLKIISITHCRFLFIKLLLSLLTFEEIIYSFNVESRNQKSNKSFFIYQCRMLEQNNKLNPICAGMDWP